MVTDLVEERELPAEMLDCDQVQLNVIGCNRGIC